MKKQLDLALKLRDESKLRMEAEGLTKEFKHYLRRMWSFK